MTAEMNKHVERDKRLEEGRKRRAEDARQEYIDALCELENDKKEAMQMLLDLADLHEQTPFGNALVECYEKLRAL